MVTIGAFVAGMVIGATIVLVWAMLSAAADAGRLYDDRDWLP